MLFQNKCLFPLNGTNITFDDIFLKIPEMSNISSRKNVDLSVEFPSFTLKLPILGANMSTIIDENSAKYLALMGGIGILHQNMSIESQVAQVNHVKRFGTPLIKDPYLIDGQESIKKVMQIFDENKIGALIVVDPLNKSKILGIITKRDINARNSDNDKVHELMTNFDELKYMKLNSLQELDIKQTEIFLNKSKVEQIPILDNDGRLLGLFTRKGLEFFKSFKNSARDNKGQLVVGAAIGQNRNPLERAEKLIKAGIDMLVIDTAHGRNINFLKVIKEVRNSFPNIYIAAGNIDNPQAAIDFVKAGVNMLKVGIGPGGACKTRVQTGFGNPQISAVGFIKQALFENGMNEIKIIGDGGISRPGNLAKVLAAGADVGMIGSMFAGTDMTPGILREINGKLYKDFRGMASSYEAQIAAKLKGQEDENPYEPIFDEGANDILPYKGDGSFLHTIKVLHGSLASALSYANSTNLNEFYQKSKFGLQTMSGANEGRPHAFGN